jgi:sarcosine oxidase delta subunit
MPFSIRHSQSRGQHLLSEGAQPEPEPGESKLDRFKQRLKTAAGAVSELAKSPRQSFRSLGKASGPDKDLEMIYREAEDLSPVEFQKLLLDSAELRRYIGLEGEKENAATLPNKRKPAALARVATHAKSEAMAQQALTCLENTLTAFRKSAPEDDSWSCRSVEQAVYELLTNLDCIPGRKNKARALEVFHEYKHLLPLNETNRSDFYGEVAKFSADAEENRRLTLLSLTEDLRIDEYETYVKGYLRKNPPQLRANVWTQIQEERSQWQAKMLKPAYGFSPKLSWLGQEEAEREGREWLLGMKAGQQTWLSMLSDPGFYLEGMGHYHSHVLRGMTGSFWQLEDRIALDAKKDKTPEDLKELEELEKKAGDKEKRIWDKLKGLERLLQVQQQELTQELHALKEEKERQQRESDRARARIGLSFERKPPSASSVQEQNGDSDSISGTPESAKDFF